MRPELERKRNSGASVGHFFVSTTMSRGHRATMSESLPDIARSPSTTTSATQRSRQSAASTSLPFPMNGMSTRQRQLLNGGGGGGGAHHTRHASAPSMPKAKGNDRRLAALRGENLNKYFDMAMSYHGPGTPMGAYVSSFPFGHSQHGVGLYSHEFQATVDTAPKYLQTATGAKAKLVQTVGGRRSLCIRKLAVLCLLYTSPSPRDRG